MNNSQDERHRTASHFEKGGLRGILHVSNPPYPPFSKGDNSILKIVQWYIRQTPIVYYTI